MKIRWMIALLLVPALAGCVTSKTFEAKEAELAALRDELNASQAQARNNLDELGAMKEQLDSCRSKAEADAGAALEARTKVEHELADVRRDLALCSKYTEAARNYTETLKAREENLREKLKAEVSAREVEISRLRDQLTVRVLDRILFKSGSAEILPEGKKVLDKLVTVLASTDDMIRVEGHTDTVPIGERLRQKYYSNWELSAARASGVVRYFEAGNHIDPVRMEAVGFSKFHPVAPGETAEDLQRNRRVEIVLTSPRIPAPAAADAEHPPQ
ncbi:MAG: OmpA family protein [Gallionellaceae bacterium]